MAIVLALGGCAHIAAPLALDAGQQGAVAQAQDYLNGLTAFSAHFSQSGWLGAGSGTVWVDRPGQLRLSYAGPGGKEMVASGGLFVAYDPSNGATTTTPVARTPLGLLLAPRIALTGTLAVTQYQDLPGLLTLTLQDTTHPDQGTLTLALRKGPMLLTGVTATDIRGRSLTLELTELNPHPLITPALFRLPGAGS